jgi:hypothetical protein
MTARVTMQRRIPRSKRRDVMKPKSPITKQQMDAVLRFLPIFEADGFTFGDWDSEGQGFPEYALSAEAGSFLQCLYDNDWIVPFDWGEWQDKAERFVSEPESLESAGLDDLCRLLTTHARKDRFCDGHLASMFECGHLTAILRQLKKIRGEMR